MGVIFNLPKVKKEKREKRKERDLSGLHVVGGGRGQAVVEDDSLSLKFSYNKLWFVVVTGLWGYKIVREMCGEKLTSTV